MSHLERVELATVKVERGDATGQGVLIPGEYILTAAHCVNWVHTGAMVLGENFIQTIITPAGKRIMVSPIAIEPCYDVAILSNVDGQLSEEMSDEWDAFMEFCYATRPVDVMFDPVPMEEPFPVFIRSHRGHWITGQATQRKRTDFGSIAVTADDQVEGGTSGGPIVDDRGRLVGITSNFAERIEDDDDCIGSVPRITALPYWAVEEIRKAQTEGGCRE